MANYELSAPNSAETKFRIGSMTKPFTAAAVMLLQERSKLSIQDSVCKYISDCPASWQPVTLRHLLSHTSGLAKQDKAADYLKTAMLPMTVAQLVTAAESIGLDERTIPRTNPSGLAVYSHADAAFPLPFNRLSFRMSFPARASILSRVRARATPR